MMVTVIDSLIVKLGLDTSAYKAGAAQASATGKQLADDQTASADKAAQAVAKAAQKAAVEQEKAAKKAAAEAEKAAKKAAAEQVRAAKLAEAEATKLERQYEKVRNEILSVTAAAFGAGAIKDFFTSVVSGQSRLLQTSKDFGMSARELDAWHKTATQALGGTAEGFDKSVQSILGGIEAFKAGDVSNTVVASLQNLGVRVVDASGKMRPMKDVLLDLSAVFQKMPNRQDQIVWAQRLGMDEGTLNMLRQGRSALSDLIDESYRNSAVNEDSAKQAEETRKAWARLGNTWENIKDTLFKDLTPAVKILNRALDELDKFMKAHPDATAGIFGTLMAATTIGGVVKLTGALGGLKTILGAVGRMIGLGGAAAGEGAAAGGVAAAGGGLMSTLGVAGVLSWLGLERAKAAGLPDVDRKTGIEDVRQGDWLAASTHLSAGDFIGVLMDKISGKSNEAIAAALASGEQQNAATQQAEQAAQAAQVSAAAELKSAAQTQRGASKALVDAAKELASAVSTNVSAAEIPQAVGPAPGSVTSGNAKSAAAAFMKMGWSREQAAGLAANLAIESKLRPDAVGDSGAAYGIGQWHADRQAEFKRVFGHDIHGSTFEEQLQFVNHELTRGREQAAGRALRQARTAGEAGAIVSAKYERPLNAEQEKVKRSAAATILYGSLGSAGASVPTAAPMMAAAYQASAGGSSTSNSHNRVQTHIGTVNVYGADAKDGHAVVASMRDELNQNGLIAQGAWGMT